jgi:hypothetical protein
MATIWRNKRSARTFYRKYFLKRRQFLSLCLDGDKSKEAKEKAEKDFAT